MAFTGSSNSILRRSSVIPCCCLRADATSALVTAPNSLPSFPLRSFNTTCMASNLTASAFASSSSRCSRWTVVAFLRFTRPCPPFVAALARPLHEHTDRQHGQGYRVHLAEDRQTQRDIDHRVQDQRHGGRERQLVALRHARVSIETVGQFSITRKFPSDPAEQPETEQH